ncbi:HAMP domain-containing sensor histidine kinase [Desulfosporosinus sp. FKA]|uniref:HAMP domain-containing sensor histidine kinase n=1 Tax=Desulfosporosinus sp. FKA TaxID=1969834 RepID=UPI000B4A4593|nr:HAMP domain-containing sensor histidine kinase [Desulfosporosinus sp. FKA]
MNKNYRRGKLEIKLILCLVFSFAIAVGVFFLLQEIGMSILNNHFNKPYVDNQRKEAISQFRSYVSDKHLTINDKDKIASWVRNEKYVSLYIYKDNKPVYAFDIANDGDGDYPKSPILAEKSLYDIVFADTKAQMYMESFFQYKYYDMISFINVGISFLGFIILMLFFIKRKTSYIVSLENEIKILEGGNLTYQITMKGNDELSSLAQSINEMRKSFIEKLDSENMARLANSDLVTAMSHDLRTPLTALVGYLDIIEYKKYKTDENLRQYIHNSREKAYQIKDLSDKLFEYFIVFNTDENDLEMESFDGIQLIEQLIEEQVIILQNNGFDFELNLCCTPFYIEVSLISIRRVFDNIFSNIMKYADKSRPVKLESYIRNRLLFLSFENKINNTLKTANSTGIGMKTCEKIIEKHKGKVSFIRTEDSYSVQISLAIEEITDENRYCLAQKSVE